MKSSSFSKNTLENPRCDFSQEIEERLKRKIIVYLAGKIPNEISSDALHWT